MSVPTPPADGVFSSNQGQIKETGVVCEWVELYRPGGYHPVHRDDTFSDGRYRVKRKFGDGSYATVWLVVDKM